MCPGCFDSDKLSSHTKMQIGRAEVPDTLPRSKQATGLEKLLKKVKKKRVMPCDREGINSTAFFGPNNTHGI